MPVSNSALNSTNLSASAHERISMSETDCKETENNDFLEKKSTCH